MKILISNDDGISANGIRCLSKILSGQHDVYVIAPDRERSAAGHSITLHTPVMVEEIKTFHNVKKAWAITGTPGDCVKIGINAILSKNEQPDLVISGINHGPNLGHDTLYSGTVSCAMEGAMLGFPSIAVSVAGLKFEPEYFEFAARFINSLIPKLPEFKFPPKSILNINIPALDEKDIKGVAITKLGGRIFTDDYEKQVDSEGKTYYMIAGKLIQDPVDNKTDVAAIRNNKISITPLTYEMTVENNMPELSKALCSDTLCNLF